MAAMPSFETLARRAGQNALIPRLQFIFSDPHFGSKQAHAIILKDGDGDLYAVGIVLEHRLRSASTGIFVPADRDGELTVIAPPEYRAEAAEKIARYLLSIKANLVLLSLQFKDAEDNFKSVTPPVSVRTRDVRRTLVLKQTLDETLGQLGARTRRNLRLSARRVRDDLEAMFVSDANITRSEFVKLNRVCAYPVPDRVAEWRFQTMQTIPGAFLSGLRSANGRWCSLLGGCRQADTSIIYWQMNRADLGAISIGTAMRYFQMQSEIGRHARFLQFSGGTPHSIQHAFDRENVTDMLWIRKPFNWRPLRLIAAKFVPPTNDLKAMLETADAPLESRGICLLERSG